LNRAAKIQKSAADVAAGHAATQIMLTRNLARRIWGASAIGTVYDVIAQRIETLRAEEHPEAALPTSEDVVKEIDRIDRDSAKRATTLAARKASCNKT